MYRPSAANCEQSGLASRTGDGAAGAGGKPHHVKERVDRADPSAVELRDRQGLTARARRRKAGRATVSSMSVAPPGVYMREMRSRARSSRPEGPSTQT